MYSYEWDKETGGILLNTTPLGFSKEPRPVYYKELDLLGFDKHWNYAKDDSKPYLWAEANVYFYRGEKVAQTRGGSLYTAPVIEIIKEPEPNGQPLKFIDIDAMIVKNKEIIDALTNSAIKWVYNTYEKYKSKVDSFHVSFSGGKDSVVLLDIVTKALPKDAYVVVFGDTQMEFPDTYEVVKETESWCDEQEIVFLRAKSHLDVVDTWNKFGPPSNVLRWCCGVHKTAPQLTTLREHYKKDALRDMAFVGVRGDESQRRSEYDFISCGKKHGMQCSGHPLLEWNSAELYLYIYANNLILNDCYKKGSSRAGCLICPMSNGKSEFVRNAIYPEETKKFIEIISAAYGLSSESTRRNLEVGGWKQRKSGKMLSNVTVNYFEQLVNDDIVLKIETPTTDWKEWMKTLGELKPLNGSKYEIKTAKDRFTFSISERENGYSVHFDKIIAKQYPAFFKLFKHVFKKAASCVGCGECAADCCYGSLKMKQGSITIENCKQCLECHKIKNGCLLYDSLDARVGGVSGMSASKSVDRYASHGPQKEWYAEFFNKKDGFFDDNGLGSKMIQYFRAFLRDAELISNNKFTPFAEVVKKVGYDTERGLALVLINLSYTPQVGCYIQNTSRGETLTRSEFVDFLCRFGLSENSASKTIGSFERLLNLFNSVGLGDVAKSGGGGKIQSFTRSYWETPDSTVILFAVYKFAEMCEGYYQFSLDRLMDFDNESKGISPAQIFGLDKQTLGNILNGLSAKYPEFISYSETHGMQTVNLRKDKTGESVLELF